MFSSDLANDGRLDTCFLTLKEDAWWTLELGANVRVSVVFILCEEFWNLEGFDILIGECILFKASCSLLLFGSLLS